MSGVAESMTVAMPPVPPGYGRGVGPPEWYMPDTFTGRRHELWRLRSVLWDLLQKGLRGG